MKSKKLNLNETIQISLEEGLMRFNNGAYEVMDNLEKQLWCVYDRDMDFPDWKDIPPKNHIDFDNAIIIAENAGLKVAWSNDVFEMWILLHFEQMPTGKILNRLYIYDRLTQIFKSIVPRNHDLDEITKHELFNYKDNMKRRERFISQVIPRVHSRTDNAIKNAKLLEAEFTVDDPYHKRNPCTMIHHLVQEIRLKAT